VRKLAEEMLDNYVKTAGNLGRLIDSLEGQRTIAGLKTRKEMADRLRSARNLAKSQGRPMRTGVLTRSGHMLGPTVGARGFPTRLEMHSPTGAAYTGSPQNVARLFE
jgi:hypothetical protein